MSAGTNAAPDLRLADSGFSCQGSYPGFQAQLWDHDLLYASYGYTLLYSQIQAPENGWKSLGTFRPVWWRNLSVSNRLTARWLRDGFHALAVLPDGHYVGAVADGIIGMTPGETEFRISHQLRNATVRTFAVTPDQKVVWGEWFHNPGPREARLYISEDQGLTWEVAYTARHRGVGGIHTVVLDGSDDAILVVITDGELPSRMLRMSCDLREIVPVLSDREGLRVGAVVPTKDAVYFAAEGPKGNYSLNRLERTGGLAPLTTICGPATSGCQVGDWVFFATELGSNLAGSNDSLSIYGSPNGRIWRRVLEWGPRLLKRRIQSARCFLAPGRNATSVLAVTVEGLLRRGPETTLWSSSPA